MANAGDRVVVIGAGMGGLAAAIRLAAAGLDVTVVEAAAGPGGKMRTLPSPAGPVDAGPTVLTMRGVFDDLFAAAGALLDDHLRLIPQPVLARHWWPDGSRLDLFPDAEATAGAIADFAGAREADRFRAFHAVTARLRAAFEGPVMQAPRPSPAGIGAAALAAPGLWPWLMPWATLAGRLAATFGDARLRQLFGRYATYVGGLPTRAPAVLALIWQSEARGVWAVAGGMHRLAQAMAGLAERAGARLLYSTPAEAIETTGGRVAAVRLAGGARIAADHVVFNGDPAALAAGLLGPAAQAALPARATRRRSLSAQVWAFAARAEGLPLVHHNLFFADDPDRDEFGPLAAGRPPPAPTLYVCAEDRAGGVHPPGPERFEIILNAPAGVKPGPEEFEACLTRTFPRLARFGLRLTPTPGPSALTGPAGFESLFPGSQGAIYGLSPDGPFATFARPTARTRLPGLWLAGGGAHPGAGVPMATLSGRHAAEAILAARASTSTFRRTATRGGTSTGSATTGAAPSR
jgi:1-hydroxycarotenoid 3,4-desaturase